MSPETFDALRPGQKAIMRSFQKHGPNSLYLVSDPMDARVCWAMAAKGLIARVADVLGGYELTDAGRALLKDKSHGS